MGSSIWCLTCQNLMGSLSAVRTPEWTLGKRECAISGIMVWIYEGGLYWERL